MRKIERTNAFRRDYKRELRGQHRRDLETLLLSVVSLLAEDKPLAERNRDHALAGEWRGLGHVVSPWVARSDVKN